MTYYQAETEYLYPSDRKYNQEEVDELENEIDKLQELTKQKQNTYIQAIESITRKKWMNLRMK